MTSHSRERCKLPTMSSCVESKKIEITACLKRGSKNTYQETLGKRIVTGYITDISAKFAVIGAFIYRVTQTYIKAHLEKK
ncbi:MAG: hypothetical protein KAR64_00405 [Thermoplasmatales archaeon]|nr:hypothetical protein [Thermoplasmatales archaeon]